MEIERQACLRINAPEWYAREDFRAWLNARHRATWHIVIVTNVDPRTADTN